MEPTFLIDQMERLRAQAERETDPVLKKEHQKTLRHLHKQIRKATTHRSPWFGFIRIATPLCGLFLVTLWGVTKLIATYGGGNAFIAGAIAILAFVVITATMLMMLKAISPEVYSSVVGQALSATKNLTGSKSTSEEKAPPDEKPSAQLPMSPASPTIEPHRVPKVTFDLNGSGEPRAPEK